MNHDDPGPARRRDGARWREAVRALILDPDDRVLLVRFEFPSATVWSLPGGGIEPDEDPITALRRELAEEVGLVDVEIGPHVWDRRIRIRFEHGGPWDGQHDRIHLLRTPAFTPRPQLSWDQLRAERVHEIRWWRLDEVVASTARFAPRRLGPHLTDLVRHGPPPSPLDTGD